ncbi:hypothetical protein [Stenotrophomonas sp. UBA7606]|uniref:hypothetical protein n=1 Tax=Stenotrophomonas sp. UBA7606 TaxID=1947559 RepID=UPI0025F0C8CD|nr:hypothetical protein [Stenotrophomonas sp. UBA7606]
MLRYAALGTICLVLGGVPFDGAAQSEDDDYSALVREDAVRQEGREMLGEMHDPYTGLLTLLHFDVVEEGVGPTIRIGRTIDVGDSQFTIGQSGEFGDWRMVLPMLTTLAATDADVNGEDEWIVERFGHPDAYKRCTAFKAPPSEGGGPAQIWWLGVSLHDGEGRTEMLLRREESTPFSVPSAVFNIKDYPLLTRSGWSIGCLPSTSNGEKGEGFFAIDPSGYRYWFDHIHYKGHHGFIRSAGSALKETRSRAFAFPSRIEDRFGNSLSISYGKYGPVAISASDGRYVGIDWREGGSFQGIAYGLVSEIKVGVKEGSSRSYFYHYGADVGKVADSSKFALTKLVQPDGSSWVFSTSRDAYRPAKYARTSRGCLADIHRSGAAFFEMTVPSGLSARYELSNTRHGYSFAPASSCGRVGFFVAKSLKRAHYSGPGVDFSLHYEYVFDRSFRKDCAHRTDCVDYTSMDVIFPDGGKRRIYSVNKYGDVREGLPVRIEVFDPQGRILRREDISYAEGVSVGSSFVVGPRDSGINPARFQTLITESGRIVAVDGQYYSRKVVEFDSLGRPSKIESVNYRDP